MAKKKKKKASTPLVPTPVLISSESLTQLRGLVAESNMANQRVQDVGEALRVALCVPKGWGLNLHLGQFEPLSKSK